MGLTSLEKSNYHNKYGLFALEGPSSHLVVKYHLLLPHVSRDSNQEKKYGLIPTGGPNTPSCQMSLALT